MRVKHVPNQEQIRDHYVSQADQRGGTLPVFRGARIQRGHGLGNVFGSLFRWLKPMVQKTATAAGRELVKTGADIASDALAGKPLKEAAEQRLKETADRGLNTIQQQVRGQQQNRPRKRKAASSTRAKQANTSQKRRKPDIFDHGSDS